MFGEKCANPGVGALASQSGLVDPDLCCASELFDPWHWYLPRQPLLRNRCAHLAYFISSAGLTCHCAVRSRLLLGFLVVSADLQ